VIFNGIYLGFCMEWHLLSAERYLKMSFYITIAMIPQHKISLKQIHIHKGT